MFKKIYKYLPQIIAMLFLAGFVVYAWTETASAPPAGNVDAPVNVSANSQTFQDSKTLEVRSDGTGVLNLLGGLGVNGLLRGYSDAIFDGRVGIGTINPQAKLDVQGDIMANSLINTGGATLPSCGSSNRGQQFLRQGGIGSEDRFYICRKRNDGTYNWIALDSQSYVSAGSHSASLIVDDASVGTISWVIYGSPSNARTSNDVYAYSSNQNSIGAFSHYLKATEFNFTIPSNVQVYGIVVNIEAAMNDDVGALSRINDVYLVRNSPVGSPKSGLSYTLLRNIDRYYSFGSVNDMWGFAWTPADINSQDFGV